jgi:hypothetical protein
MPVLAPVLRPESVSVELFVPVCIGLVVLVVAAVMLLVVVLLAVLVLVLLLWVVVVDVVTLLLSSLIGHAGSSLARSTMTPIATTEFPFW